MVKNIENYGKILRVCAKNDRSYFTRKEVVDHISDDVINDVFNSLAHRKYIVRDRTNNVWLVPRYKDHMHEIGRFLARYIEVNRVAGLEVVLILQTIVNQIPLKPTIKNAILKSTVKGFKGKIREALGLTEKEFDDLRAFFFIFLATRAIQSDLTLDLRKIFE